MALDLGELFGRLSMDDRPMQEGLDKGEKRMSGFGQTLGAMAVGIGAVAAAALGAGFMAWMEEGKVGGSVAAALGGTADDAKRYGKEAGELYAAGFGESVTDIGDAFKALSKAGLIDFSTSKTELDDMTKRALTVRDAFGIDVVDSGRAVAQMLATGIAPNAKEAFDIIALGATTGANKADDLGDTFNEYSTIFRKLGLDAQSSLGLMTQMIRGGARDSDMAADALKEFSIRAIDGSKTTSDAFKGLGLNAKRMAADIAAGGPRAAAALDLTLDRIRALKSPIDQNAMAVALFGSKAEDSGRALMAMDLTTAKDGMDSLAGSVDKAGTALASSGTAKFEMFKRKVEINLVNFISNTVIPKLEDFAAWFKANRDWAQPLAIGLGTIAAAVWAVNIAMYANPVTLWAIAIVGAIAMVVGEVLLIMDAAKKMPERWAAAWEWVKSATSAAVAWLSTVPGAIMAFLSALPGQLWNLFSSAMVGLAGIVGTGLALLINSIWNFPGNAWNALQNLGPMLMSAFRSGWAWAKQATTDGINTIKNSLSALPAQMMALGAMALQGLVNGIRSMAGKLRNLAHDMASEFLNSFKKALDMHSPSKKMFKLGRDGIGKGAEQGVEASIPAMASVAGRLASSATGGYAASSASAATPAAGGYVEVRLTSDTLLGGIKRYARVMSGTAVVTV